MKLLSFFSVKKLSFLFRSSFFLLVVGTFIVSCSSENSKTQAGSSQSSFGQKTAAALVANLFQNKLLASDACVGSTSSDVVADKKGVVYIKPCGTGNGSSWENAAGVSVLRNTALLSSSVKALWVASGVYTPTDLVKDGTTDLSAFFSLKSGLAIYGGFYGNEKNLNDRNIFGTPSILCGFLDHDSGSCTGGKVQSYQIVKGKNVDSSTILDGFTLTGANSDVGELYVQNKPVGKAGAISLTYSTPTLRNLIIAKNKAVYGAGLFVDANNTKVAVNLEGVFFSDNQAIYGGAIYNQTGAVALKNVVFEFNQAKEIGGAIYSNGVLRLNIGNLTKNKAAYGGGIYAAGSMIVQQTTFDGNSATYGGGVYNNSIFANVVVQSLFIHNDASFGSSIYNNGNSYGLTINSILWDGKNALAGNKLGLYYSITQGQTSQSANLNGNWSNGGSFADHFENLTSQNSPVSYYPIKASSMAKNKGARVWATVEGKFYFFPPYFPSTVESLNNANYSEFTSTPQGWEMRPYQKLPSSAVELTATDVRGFWKEGGDVLPDLGPYEQNAVSKFYLDPSLFGYESFNAEGLSISPTGGVYFKQHDLLSTPKNTLSIGLFFADPKDSLTKNKWRTSFSQSLDDILPYDPTVVKTGLYLSAEEACSQGWENSKTSLYHGYLKEDSARFNRTRGLCEIYDKNGYLVTHFAIRTGLGALYEGTHIFTNEDGRQMLFEKSDASPGSFYTKSQVNVLFKPSLSASNGTFVSLLSANLGWSLKMSGVNFAFDSKNRLTAVQDTTSHTITLSYTAIPSNDASANAYYTELGLKPTEQITLTAKELDSFGAMVTEQMIMLRDQDKRVITVQSQEKPIAYAKQLAFNPPVDGSQQEINRLYFHYNSQELVDYISPSSFMDGDFSKTEQPIKYSLLHFTYNDQQRLYVYANLLETWALLYSPDGLNQGLPLSFQSAMGKSQTQYSYGENQLTQRDATSQELIQDTHYSFFNEQQRIFTADVKQETGMVRLTVSYNSQGEPR